MKKDSEALALFSSLEKVQSQLLQNFQKLKTKLEASHETQERLIAHMSDGLIFVSLDGNIIFFNPAAEKLTKLKAQDVLDAPFWHLFSDDLLGFSMKKALASPDTYHRTLLTLNHHTEVEVTTSYVPERGLLVLLRDRTELFQLERSLRHAEQLKELGEMAASLAHEIRNPLGAIQGFAELLLRDLHETSQKSMVHYILEGTRLLNRLVTNVLDYARPLDLNFAYVDLALIIEETLSAHFLKPKPVFEKRRASFFVCADKERLKLVLMNLLRNSCEADAQEIVISLEENGHLCIADDGKGISSEFLEKIFTPFFTTKKEGVGLGLAEAYKVIQAHGGEISAEAKKQEKGTCFTLKLKEAHGN